ncbi:MAG: hybrid sensor histidine kinase/response regulator [Planctomycetota bacterium]|jgi:PAS domain S-box-containing protein
MTPSVGRGAPVGTVTLPEKQPSNMESAHQALTRAADALREAAETLRAPQAPPPEPDQLGEALGRSEGLAVKAVDAEGRLCRWGQGCERVYGYAAADVLGMDFVDLLVPRETQPLTRQVVRTVFETSRTPRPSRTRLIRKGGVAVTVLSSWSLVETAAGPELMMVDVDLTDLVRTFEQRQELQQHADGAEKMALIADLIGHISHHFNNALAVIQGNAELIRRERADDADLAELVEPILEAARSSAGLTDRLLAYTRPAPPVETITDVHAAIRAVADELGASAPPGVEIATHLAAPQSIVSGDADALKATLWQLGRNACQAVADGGHVTFTTQPAQLDEAACRSYPHDIRPGPYVRITIGDTGDGMDAETRRRAFEPFYTTRPFGQGDGLGLASVYGFVRQQRGAIYVVSEPQAGTDVQLYLPLTAAPATEAETLPAETVVTPPPEVETPSQRMVLIADDEPSTQAALTRILSDAGYGVVAVGDGAQAVDYLRAHGDQVDLVVVDVLLGPAGGPETLRRLQAVNGSVKALFSSGFLRATDAQMALDCGARGFLAKPYDPQTAVDLIARAIAGD